MGSQAFSVTETEQKETFYHTKLIKFFGRKIPIVLQNHNGPCPLIAICNVLSLQNILDLSSYTPKVSQETLVQLVGNRLMYSIIKGKYSSYAEFRKQICYDAFHLIPKLTTGIDVNVQFRRIDDFEFTMERAIFDIVDIPLYHGWLVDPQDRETSKALGSKSYNTLMWELAHLETLAENEDESGKSNEEDTVDIVALATASLVVPSPCVSSGQPFGKSSHSEEDTDDIISPTTASLGVPSLCVSSSQSFGKSPYNKEDTVDVVSPTTACLGVPSSPCVSSSQFFGKSPHNEEDTVDVVAATNATLGIPSPCASSSQSFGTSPHKQMKWDIAFKANILELVDGFDGLNSQEWKYEWITRSETVKPVVTDRRMLIFDDSNALGSDHVKKTGSDSTSQKSQTESQAQKELDSTFEVIEPKGSDHVKKTGSDSTSQKSETEGQAQKESDSTFEVIEPGNFQYDCNKSVSSGLLASTSDPTSLIHKVDEPESYTANVDSDELVCEGEKRSKEKKLSIRQGELVENFLKNSASQLTVFGLSCLHEEVMEFELCVFFRNNHFNTMIKYQGELYILVTDQGYLNQPDLVWEKLNEVNGNTLFMTGDFKEFKLDDHSNSSWQEPNAKTNTDVSVNESKFMTGDFEVFESDDQSNSWLDEENAMFNSDEYLAGINDESQEHSSFSSDLELAMALQEMEYEQLAG